MYEKINKEYKSIKFYLDESVNKEKKDKIMKFLKECRDMENRLLEYYWNNFHLIVQYRKWLDFYKNRYMIREHQMVFSHYMHVLAQVYEQLKSIETKIIKHIHFKFEDKQLQRIYNYCAGFIFEWDRMEKYIQKQMKEYKRADADYYNFLMSVFEFISDEQKYSQLKKDIENKFYEIKDIKFKQPVKRELQIRCVTSHTVKIEKGHFQWLFIIDNNDVIGQSKNKKPLYDQIIIPVKFSAYHKEILKDKQLQNTFNLKLNKYGKIEVIGCYKVEIEYPESKSKEIVGIDIGLNKLITTSDGEVIEQNERIVKRLKKLVKKQSNRDSLQAHLCKKYNDESFELSNKNYSKQQRKLTRFVTCDNRYRVKKFLESRLDNHIIIEDLQIAYSATKSKMINFLLKRMHISQIKNYLIDYSKKLGIKVSQVNAAYTSQTCPECSHVHKDNRKTQEKFSCVSCGYSGNADFVASVNIKNRYFDKRIKLNTPLWRVREILGVE